MSNLKNIVICLLFLYLGTHSAFSEIPEPINFSYISINEGLSQSTVFAIDQDKRGNMWFATYDGVNMMDTHSRFINTMKMILTALPMTFQELSRPIVRDGFG